MFVDASAIISMLTGEPDGERLAAVLQNATTPVTSAITIFESVLGVSRKLDLSVDIVQDEIQQFLDRSGISIAPITAEHAQLALAAHARFGKGRGHPAQLNMGDCFAYAVAKSHNAPLLYKGDDFSRTDIRPALEIP